ncbi:MAG: hypothetical protein IJ637_05545, partial [Prevotella sp.]|nr:hypothetical protein [Prevotella sp.]
MKKILSLVALLVTGLTSVWADSSVTVSVGTDITDEDQYYITFSSDKALDFTDVNGIKAYVVTKKNTGSWGDVETVTLTRVNTVSANTGLVIVAEESKDYTVPVLIGSVTDEDEVAISKNLLSVATEDIDLYVAIEVSGYYKSAGVTVLTQGISYGEGYIGFAFPERPNATNTSFLPSGTVYLNVTSGDTDEGYWQGFAGFVFADASSDAETVSVNNIGELKAVTVAGNYEVALTNAVVTYAGENN